MKSKRPTEKKRCFIAGVFAAIIATAPATSAEIVNWGDAFALQGSGVNLNPAVLVGFNPQPEPPAGLIDLTLPDRTTAVVTISADPGATFVLSFGAYSGIEATPFRFDAGGDPDARGDFRFMALSDAGDLTFELNLMSSSGGVPTPGTWEGFNPQPDPPAVRQFGGAGQAQGFAFEMTSLSDVTLTLRVFEESAGEYASFAQIPNPVPVPGALILLPGALGVLGLLRRQRA